MIRQLYFTKNEHGFILPAVLLVISVVFLLLTHGTNVYRNELFMTDTQMEQTKVETLFQSSRQLFLKDIETTGKIKENAIYTLPHGEVIIYVQQNNETSYKLTFTITTDNNAVKSIESPLTLEGVLKDKNQINDNR